MIEGCYVLKPAGFVLKPGDMVKLVFRFGFPFDAIIPASIGVIIEKQPFSYFHWRVLFPECGILDCRESDLMVIS